MSDLYYIHPLRVSIPNRRYGERKVFPYVCMTYYSSIFGDMYFFGSDPNRLSTREAGDIPQWALPPIGMVSRAVVNEEYYYSVYNNHCYSETDVRAWFSLMKRSAIYLFAYYEAVVKRDSRVVQEDKDTFLLLLQLLNTGFYGSALCVYYGDNEAWKDCIGTITEETVEADACEFIEVFIAWIRPAIENDGFKDFDMELLEFVGGVNYLYG
ncbi:MAG: hypothetical protein AAFO91_00215, partial [Bacteroidota bacterium]